MQTSLRASLRGKEMVKLARRDAKWARNDPRWLFKVSIEVDPNPDSRRRYEYYLESDIQTLEAQISQIACVSLSTWERFLQGKSINSETFKACCHTLGLPWQAIAELDLVKSDCDTGREANKLNAAFDLAFNKGNYVKAKKVLANIVPNLIKETKFSASNSVIDRLNAAILVAEFLIPKQVDALELNLMLGDINSGLGYCKDALRHYESVFSEAPEGKHKFLAALNSGATYLNTCQYQKALYFLKEVSSIQAPELIPRVNYLRGWIAMYQGELQNAANLLRQNIYKAQFFEDYHAKAFSYHFLARTNYEVNEFERAIKLLKKQYFILEKNQAPPDMIAHSFRWLARCYWKLQDLQSTEHYLSIARHLFKQSHPQFSPGGLAHLHLHRGEIHQKLGNLNEAATEIQRSIDIWESMAYTKGIGDARFALGKIYNQSANYRDAIKEYEIAYATYSGMEYPYKSTVALKALENVKS